MVELKSCSASLVNASALCAIEQEMRGEGVNHVNVAQISAELQRERQKNAELTEKISFLEAQIQDRGKEASSNLFIFGQMETSLKKCKRQKTETTSSNVTEAENVIKSESDREKKQESTERLVSIEERLVNWMSMNETQFLQCDKAKDAGESTADCDDKDDSDDEDYIDEEDIGFMYNDRKEGEASENSSRTANDMKYNKQELPNDQKRKEVEKITNYKAPTPGKKPPKVAFCPREVKRVIDSEALQQKNAQSHTMRKIIVFASLGIRHGCEDMYELDFNHFSILRKGEPYESPTNPGEHVLYENPRVRRKVLYPNRQNHILCPVQILEEEKAMRPSDSSCPSCLFLCIKYGGRTRNLPQNEYVRQRMGRNKLKSFGPLICQMAMLAHIRSGSFFFKALGITLLFMAGFPDDLVQRETKYRNLDLLQKYYRTDEEAEGEELFLAYPMSSETASPSSQHHTGKICSTKSKLKKQTNQNKPHDITQRSSALQPSTRLNSRPPAHQFGLVGYASIHTHATAAFPSIPSQPKTPLDHSPISNNLIANSSANVSYPNQAPFHHQMIPPQPTNAFVPAVMYWPHPNTYPLNPHYASTYSYTSFPSNENYVPIYPQPYFSRHPSSGGPLIPRITEHDRRNDTALHEADSDSDSSSNSTEPKKN
ncbi:hypothetical protein TIFTF001_019043 [Ficus carica]|uniref:Homer protein n=1 Tax=Ficus carica TaxID=3494 RepID=A0AA88D9U3_FICCA|nr:hypothetical protein TIFTF001_019043 [Ficus carica]